MKVLMVLSSLLAAALAAGDAKTDAAVAKFQATVKAQVDVLFKTSDTNGDGKFDQADMSSIFTEYDANKDGSVSEQEFQTRFSGSQGGLSVIGKGLFLELDMDKSKAITASDINLYFKKIDQNDDGNVSKHEFEQYFTQLFTILYILQAKAAQGVTTAV
ncbi:uncharacterized protein LOC124148941 [Haliotis rufescens]|uniref:uncharacterized protein LOC124148941 n=1 Tax=Haliotis rufescens TaxID=6454 RepID=UPI00201F1BAE|nr:uncharacterized protein LOC124148941 [Haliotis rufescens]